MDFFKLFFTDELCKKEIEKSTTAKFDMAKLAQC